VSASFPRVVRDNANPCRCPFPAKCVTPLAFRRPNGFSVRCRVSLAKIPAPCSRQNIKTNFQRGFVETEGFQRIQKASENEQRELRILRAGGILPVGASTTSLAAEKPPTPLSPRSTGRRWPRGSPPFLARLVEAFRELPLVLRNAVGASEARRHRRRSFGSGTLGTDFVGPERVSDPLGAGGIGGSSKEGGAPIESGLVLARRWQRTEEEKALEESHVPRGGDGGAARAGDVEMGGWRETASRFGLYRRGGGGDGHGPRLSGSASEPVVDTLKRGEGTDRQGEHIALEEIFGGATKTTKAADGPDVEYSHSNRMFRRACSRGGEDVREDQAAMKKMYERISELVDETQEETRMR